MRKDIFKKIRLISKSGFLASSLINIGAMESVENKIINESKINNEIKINTLEQFLNQDGVKDLSLLNNNNIFNKIDDLFNDLDKADTSRYKIIDKKDFLKLIEEHKEDILYPIRFGDKAREIAYYLSQNLREYIGKQRKNYNENYISKYYSDLKCYFIDKNKDKNQKTTGLSKIFDPIIKRFKSENINNEIFKINKDFDCSKLILIDSDKFNNDHIHNIGRNVLNGITKDIYKNLNGEDKASSELKRLFNGEMNCTCNAFMLYTFLRLNKILCYTYAMHCHEFVLIPLKDKENKAINFYKVDLYEKETINNMSFNVEDIIKISKNDNIWIGINISDHKTDLISKCSLSYNRYTPTYMYYKNLRDFILDINKKITKKEYEFENINKDIELIKYYLNGLKNAWEYINKTYKDKDDNYSVKFLPIGKEKCLFLPNVIDLGEPELVESNRNNSNNKKIMFNSIAEPKKHVNLMRADIDIPNEYEEDLEDVKLKIIETNFEDNYIKYSFLYKEKEIFKEIQESNIKNAICVINF